MPNLIEMTVKGSEIRKGDVLDDGTGDTDARVVSDVVRKGRWVHIAANGGTVHDNVSIKHSADGDYTVYRPTPTAQEEAVARLKVADRMAESTHKYWISSALDIANRLREIAFDMDQIVIRSAGSNETHAYLTRLIVGRVVNGMPNLGIDNLLMWAEDADAAIIEQPKAGADVQAEIQAEKEA